MRKLITDERLSFSEGCLVVISNQSEITGLLFEAKEAVSTENQNPEIKGEDIAHFVQQVVKESKWPYLDIKILGYGDRFDHAFMALKNYRDKGFSARKLCDGQKVEVIFSTSEKRVRVAGNFKTRVMVLDDSGTIRKLLANIFKADPELEVIGQAELPSIGLKMIEELRPDVLTLDIHMPEMNGVEFLKKMMKSLPTPTVMISSLSLEDGGLVFDALEAGAIDYIQKPSMENLAEVTPQMIEKVKSAAKARLLKNRSKTLPSAKIGLVSNGSDINRGKSTQAVKFDGFSEKNWIVIGSSTGGTEALKEVLIRMPSNIPPILIVQHIPAVFSSALAQRLNSLCPFEVREAKSGDVPTSGVVLIAPGGKQMKVVKSGRTFEVQINDEEPVNRHRPSVDYLFESVSLLGIKPGIGAILTGMGNDGAKGLLKLKSLGWQTIAQSERTCVVYGMPKEAVKLGGASEVVDLFEIPVMMMKMSHAKKRAS